MKHNKVKSNKMTYAYTCIEILYCGFNLYIPGSIDIEHLFIYLLTICIWYIVKCLFKFYAHLYVYICECFWLIIIIIILMEFSGFLLLVFSGFNNKLGSFNSAIF